MSTLKYTPVESQQHPGWYQIPGYSGYLANRDGYIFHKRLGHITQGGISDRYRKVSVYPDGELKAKLRYTHDLICRAFYGPPAPGQVVIHIDNDRLNLRAENLRWGTQQENMQMMWDTNRRKKASLESTLFSAQW